MATEQLIFDILVDGKPAVQQIKKVDKAQNELEATTVKSTDNMNRAWLVLGAAIAATVVTIRKSITLAGVQVKAETALTLALKLNTNAIDKNVDSWTEYAANLQDASTTGDELIIQQLALLNTLGLTDAQMKVVIQTSLDLAAATGTTFDAAVRNLSKTLSGLQGELGESIPALKALTAEQLKAGEGIALVSKLVKGQAKALAETDYGRVERTINSLGDRFEELGTILLKLAASSGIFFLVDKAIAGIAVSLSAANVAVGVLTNGFKQLFGTDTEEDVKSLENAIEEFNVNLSKFLGDFKKAQQEIEDAPFEITIVAVTQSGKFKKMINDARDTILTQLAKGELTPEEFLISLDEIEAWSSSVQVLLDKGLNIEEAVKIASKDFDELESKGLKIAKAIGDAFQDSIGTELKNVLNGGKASFKDFANSVIADIGRILIKQTITAPLSGALSSGIGALVAGFFGSSNGNVFSNGSPQKFADGGVPNMGSVKPFADGGVPAVLNAQKFADGGLPTGRNLLFPMANGGVGSMNERGQEAIIPLERTSTGQLGVNASGISGGGTTVVNKVENVWTVQAIDASSFKGLLLQERAVIEDIINTSFGNNGRARVNL